MGLTQQRFAVEVVETAVTTVSRWETTHPPSGDTLLKLADVAWQHDQTALSREFQILFLDEIMPRLKSPGISKGNNDSGYIYYRWNSPQEAAYARQFLLNHAPDLEEHQQ